MNDIAQVYAQSLFDLALENNQLEDYLKDVKFVDSILESDPSFIPFFVQAWMSGMDFRNVIFMFLCIALSVVFYYPFFKIYEKQLVEEELKETEEEDDFEW